MRRFKELRKSEHGGSRQTQEQFAEAFGVSLDTVRNWEQGRTMPPADKLCELSDYYGCSIDYILGRIECETIDRQRIQDLTHLSNKAIKAIVELPFYDMETGEVYEPDYELADADAHEVIIEKQAINGNYRRIEALNALLESPHFAAFLDKLYSCKHPGRTVSEEISRNKKMIELTTIQAQAYKAFVDEKEWHDEEGKLVQDVVARYEKEFQEIGTERIKEERRSRDDLCRYNVQFVASKIAEDLLREGAEERGEHSAKV